MLALDFDGVICASSAESSFSSLVASKQTWPSSFESLKQNSTSWNRLQTQIQQLRPIIETGYENMLVARYMWENNVEAIAVESVWNSKFRDDLVVDYGIDKVGAEPVIWN